METALIVAIIVAVASLISAFVAWRNARHASDSAHRALSVNHQVAVIDRDADELRTAFQNVAEKLGELGLGLKSSAYIGGVLGALESLMACRAADEEMEKTAVRLQNQIAARGSGKGVTGEVERGSIKDVRAA